MEISHIWRKEPKRGRTMSKGMVQSAWLIRCVGEKITRRVYEDWKNIDKRGSNKSKDWHVPFVVIISGEPYTLTEQQRQELENVK